MEYEYSILGNVTAQQVVTSRLDNDIKESLSLSSAIFRGIVTKDDALYVLFDKAIETSEKTELDTIIQDHTPAALPTKTRHLPFYPHTRDVEDTFFVSTGCLLYPGDTALTTITAIDMFSMMSPGATSYDIQIINRSNNSLIAEQNYTNTNLSLNSFDTINTANIPSSQTGIEVMVKINKNGNAKKIAHIDQVVFWLD